MTDPEKRICRYFNTVGGCWYADSCKFMHIPNKKPPCKFHVSSGGCRFGESCHFAHDRAPFKSVENYNESMPEPFKETYKENLTPAELSSGTNNNSSVALRNLVDPRPGGVIDINMEAKFDKQAATSVRVRSHRQRSRSFSIIVQRESIPAPSEGSEVIDPSPPTGASSKIRRSASLNLPRYNPTSGDVIADASGDRELSITDRLNSESIRDLQNKFLIQQRKLHGGDLESTNQQQCLAELQSSNNSMSQYNRSAGSVDVCRQPGQVGRYDEALHGVVESDGDVVCGSCRRVLENRGNESYCTLLKDHYLECFLEKEGDHVKCVKAKAGLEPGQMYWCKSCILIFEKPWSLFQHMADKAKGIKVQRWEKKIHLDWMDNVAGLMAGYDLGLFSPAKLRVDLRNLLADQHTVEEDMEAAAITAAAMMHWFAPLTSSPWRLQQRELMRKIEQLNRQMMRKSALGGPSTPPPAAALALMAAASQTGAHLASPYRSTGVNAPGAGHFEHANRTRAWPGSTSHRHDWERPGSRLNRPGPAVEVVEVDSSRQSETTEDCKEDRQIEKSTVDEASQNNGDSDRLTDKCNDIEVSSESNRTTASGDDPMFRSDAEDRQSTPTPSATPSLCERTCQPCPNPRYDDDRRRFDYHEHRSSSNHSHPYGDEPPLKPMNSGVPTTGNGYPRSYHHNSQYNSRQFTNGGVVNDLPRRFPHRGYRPYRPGGYGPPPNGALGYFPRPRGMRHYYRSGNRPPFNHNSAVNNGNGMNGNVRNTGPNSGLFNPPSFHASLDLNCGFTNEEVDELLSQGIKPWDNEARTALAVLRGEMDHLLD